MQIKRMSKWTRVPATISLLCFGLQVHAAQDQRIPNDPLFNRELSFGGKPSSSNRDLGDGSLSQISRAWTITTGSKNVVVAILDDGFCYLHPDLEKNIWKNPGESAVDANGVPKQVNGVDDDRNGYIDDVLGWDFVFNTPDVDCHVFDGTDRSRIAPYPHSMGAMGIIGAEGNNGIGVAGINWAVSMMLLRIGVQGTSAGQVGAERVNRVVKAIHYAADNGARIINWSGFVRNARPQEIAELHSAIDYAGKRNVLVVIGAGNDLADLDDDKNCAHVPECFEAPNLIKVAEVAFDGRLYVASGKYIGGSNYGAKRVDIAAVGENYTTDVSRGGMPTYGLTGGTSNAAPVVSGVAGLMLSVNPSLTAGEMKQILLDTATSSVGLAGKVKSGIVNAYAAVLAAQKAVH